MNIYVYSDAELPARSINFWVPNHAQNEVFEAHWARLRAASPPRGRRNPLLKTNSNLHPSNSEVGATGFCDMVCNELFHTETPSAMEPVIAVNNIPHVEDMLVLANEAVAEAAALVPTGNIPTLPNQVAPSPKIGKIIYSDN